MNARARRAAVVGVLYTGGTFGMVRSQRGYVPSIDLPARAQAELHAAGDPDGLPELVWLDAGLGPPVNSSDITPSHWYALADAIRNRVADCAGFVVIHGTDTLAHTASALSFLLAGVNAPIVVTGARAPLGEAGSDALDNFRGALRAAASGRPVGASIAFGGYLLRANRSSKRFGTRANPFASPRVEPLARLGPPLEWIDEPPAPRPPLPPARAHPRAVVVLAVYPGIDGDTVRAVTARSPAGLLLEAYPAGVGPGGDTDFAAAIAEADAAGIVVAAVAQSQHGSIRLGHYASSTPLHEAGLVGAADMTPEAALTKLHYLLGTDLDGEDLRAHFARDLCGELSTADGSSAC